MPQSVTQEQTATNNISQWFVSAQLGKELPRAVMPLARRCVIGRQPGLDLTLNSAFVSGRHAELTSLAGRLVIHDLGSRNGTYVNGHRIRRPVYLGSGDLIRLGDIKLRVHCRDPRQATGSGPLDQLNNTWLRSQFNELRCDGALMPLLEPIVDPRGEEVVGYAASVRSHVSGLETARKMFDAARVFGCEVELADQVRRAIVAHSWPVSQKALLFLKAQDTENLLLEVIPSIEKSIAEFPQIPLLIELSHLEIRSDSTLAEFFDRLRGIGVNWVFDRLRPEHLVLIRTLSLTPSYVRLHPSLTEGFGDTEESASADPFRLQALRDLIDSLQQAGCQVIASNIESAAAAQALASVGIDLLQGTACGEELPLPSMPLISTLDFKLDSSHVLEEELDATNERCGSSILKSRASGLSNINRRTSTIRLEDIRRAMGEESPPPVHKKIPRSCWAERLHPKPIDCVDGNSVCGSTSRKRPAKQKH